ncbi:hypothetical protein BT69DRAFT_1335405 [Atractiella rhizophila]|nr:hypothetical protein BT69DRAFT_1335405 [Atractiella rhizophila]
MFPTPPYVTRSSSEKETLVRALTFLGLQEALPFLEHSRFTTVKSILNIRDQDLQELGMAYELRMLLLTALGKKAESSSDMTPQDGTNQPEHPSPSSDATGSSSDKSAPSRTGQVKPKRKYVLHPKPDVLAPKRPPNAFTMFANSIRKELMDQGYSFTDVSRTAGDRWASREMVTMRAEIEKKAAAALQEYHRKKAAYQLTPEYREYQAYLVAFEKNPKTAVLRSRSQPVPSASDDELGPTPSGLLLFPNPFHTSLLGEGLRSIISFINHQTSRTATSTMSIQQ